MPLWTIVRDFVLGVLASVTANIIGPYDTIGFSLAGIFALIGLVRWHRARIKEGKRGMDSWYFIGLSAFVAAIAVAVAAYGLGLRASAPSQKNSSSSNEIQQRPTPLLEEQSIYTGAGSNSLFAYSGKFTRSGKLVRVYLQYERSPADRPLIPVFEKHNFVKGEKIVVPISSYTDSSNLFRWGTESSQSSETQSLGSPAKVRVLIFDEDGNEIQQYVFLLWPTIWDIEVSTAQQHNMRVPRPEDLMPVPKITSGNVRILTSSWWDWK
ncbi:hypothetical protein [Bradyrhizobium sp. SZCCHNR2026]|uniref:hypothetical protein n=1 Tax=Bradyrhizobium sp. SZCCHNR2026 TaxID=3057381 RepID=UPI0029161F7C|nr:hypothetical protein [Bradyrhizobium sp. SZCCHNR2026]